MNCCRRTVVILACVAAPAVAWAQHDGHLPHNIPDFCATPTIRSIASGSWSSPAIWSPARVPAAGDVVVVSQGDAVTYGRALIEGLVCPSAGSGTPPIAPHNFRIIKPAN